jgi:hypothetical protein
MWLRNSGLWNVLMPLALVAFLIGSLPLSWMHRAVHVHEHEHLHTDTAEADPCHRAIYHAEAHDGCHHTSHIGTTVHECELCKVVQSRAPLFHEPCKPQTEFGFNEKCKPAGILIFGNDELLADNPRGPPVLS